MITKRDIIKYLNTTNHEWITSRQLAVHFQVTQRTIQNYIKIMREEYDKYLECSRQGIRIKEKIPLSEEPPIPLTYTERKTYILQKLLSHEEAFDLDVLAQNLCISEITLQNEIKRIRRSLEAFDLTLKTKNNQLFITGTTKAKKALMIRLIYEEAENSLVSISTLNDIFQNYDAEKIRAILLKKLDEAHFFMDEYSLINLLLHILIAMDQQSSAVYDTQDDMSREFAELNRHFVTIIDNVCSALEEFYKVKFTNSNRYQFTLLLMTRAIRNKEALSEMEYTKLSIDDDIFSLVHKIITEIYNTYDLDLHTNEFIIAFSLHIKNMLIRLRQKISIHNPLLYSIKLTSPFIYDIAVYISNIIAKAQHVEFYDDEIAYIALHIGARIEEINSTCCKLTAALVCPHYYSYPNQPLKKIESYFHEDMMITTIITNPIELTAVYDIVISTIPIESKPNCVIISNFFNDKDREHISHMIQHLKKDRSRAYTVQLLKKLIHRDLFRVNITYASKNDAIEQMGDMLIEKGYVTEAFLTKLRERESISATNFGRIAIPHPMDYSAEKTVMAVSLLKKPILWGNTSVSIIFMFCINKADFSSFSDIFSFLASTCSNDDNLEALLHVASYEAFMDKIIALYK